VATGLISVAPMTISRLRAAIDAATGVEGLGSSLIRSGVGEEFYVSLRPSQIAFDPSFRELLTSKHIAAEVLNPIIECCRELHPAWTRRYYFVSSWFLTSLPAVRIVVLVESPDALSDCFH
jgi:hypothetical protein